MVKRLVLVLFGLLSLLALNLAVASHPQPLKIAASENFPPYSFRGQDGQMRGLFIDLWQLWSEQAGHPVEFVGSSWAQSLDALEQGRVDIHSGMAVNAERQQRYTLSDAFYNFRAQGFINRADLDKLDTLEQLNGEKVGVIKGSFLLPIFASRYPDIQVLSFASFESMRDALLSQKIRAFFNDDLGGTVKLMHSFHLNQIAKMRRAVFPQQASAAVAKQNTALAELVNSGLQKISAEQITALKAKWQVPVTGATSASIPEQRSSNVLLSEAQLQWLQSQPVIQIATMLHWKNYSEIDDNNRRRGFNYDLLAELNHRLGDHFAMAEYNKWSDAYQATINREVDAVIGLSWSPEREQLHFDYTPSYISEPHFLITRPEDTDIHSLDDLNGKWIWTLKDSILSSVVIQQSPQATVTGLDSEELMYREVAAGNGDAVLFSSPDLALLERYGLVVANKVYSRAGELAIGVPKGNPMLVEILSAGLKSIPPAQLRQLQDRWFSNAASGQLLTESEQQYLSDTEIVIGIEKNWPPFDFTDNRQQWKGIVREIVDQLAAKTGLRYRVVPGDWHELLEWFDRGDIDLLPIIYNIEERREKMLFTQPYLSDQSFLYVKENRSDINHFDDLAKATIAQIKGHAQTAMMKRHYPDIKVLGTDSTKQSMAAVLTGTADALLVNPAVKQYLEREYSMIGLRPIEQQVIKSEPFAMAVAKDNPLLHSILNKALSQLSSGDLQSITSRWFSREYRQRPANIAIVESAPPFSFDREPMLGISPELTAAVVEAAGYQIGQVKSHNLSTSAAEIFAQQSDLDVLVGVKETPGDGLYYSDVLFNHDNVVVTRIAESRFIDSLEKLSELRVGAMMQDYQGLGQDFQDFAKRHTAKGLYRGYPDYSDLFEAFLSGELDALVIDKQILSWLAQSYGLPIEQFRIDHLLGEKSRYQAAFRQGFMRDRFNVALGKLKRTGGYQRIADHYRQPQLASKITLAQFVADLSALAIFENSPEQLKQLYSLLLDNTPIEAIRAYDSWQQELFQLNVPQRERSLQLLSNLTFGERRQTTGSVQVGFKQQLAVGEDYSVPDRSLFKAFPLEVRQQIDRVYQNLRERPSTVNLTRQERQWLKQHPQVNFTSNQWHPIVFSDSEKASGLVIDYLELIGQKTGINFQFVPSESWSDALNALQSGAISVLPGLGYSEQNRKLGLFSEQLTSFPYVIVTQQGTPYIENLAALRDRTIVVPRFYTSYHLIREHYPDIKIITTSGVEQAMQAVSDGRADAFVGHLAVAAHQIKVKFNHLKIAGLSGLEHDLRIAIKSSEQPLREIINKGIAAITEQERRQIRERWLQTDVQTEVNYRLIYQILAAALLIIAAILFYTHKLSRAKREIEQARAESETARQQAEQQHSYFLQIFNNQASGVVIFDERLVILDANQQLAEMTGYPLEQMIGVDSGFLFQSQAAWQAMRDQGSIVKQLRSNKLVDISTVFLRSDNSPLAVRVIASSFPDQQEFLAIVTDITEITRASEALKDSNQKLNNTIETLTRTQDQLVQSEKMASLGNLVAGIAHEINTPIGVSVTIASSLGSMHQGLSDKLASGQLKKSDLNAFLSQVEEASTLLYSSLNNASQLVKNFKQVSADQTSLQRRRFDAASSIREILSTLTPTLRNIRLEQQLPEQVQMDSYPGALGQVITNLCTNARHHAFSADEQGLVTIQAQPLEGERLEIVVADNGKGIPTDHLDKIFDPFFTTKMGQGGTGLGLNISYNLVTGVLGGEISVSSEPGEGSRFSLILPLKAPGEAPSRLPDR